MCITCILHVLEESWSPSFYGGCWSTLNEYTYSSTQKNTSQRVLNEFIFSPSPTYVARVHMWLHRTSYQQGLRNIWHDQDRACRTTHLLTPPQALLSFLQPKTAHPRKQMVQNKQQLASITDPEFNVVWWPRAWDTNRAQAVVDATRAVGLFKEQVVVDRNGAQSLAQQVEQLFPHGAADPLHALLADDVCNIVDIYLDVLGMYLCAALHLLSHQHRGKTLCKQSHTQGQDIPLETQSIINTLRVCTSAGQAGNCDQNNM